VLDFARQTSTCVDKPYSIAVVRKDGIHVFDDEIIKEFAQSLDVFGAAVNRLFLACGDTTLRSEQFDKQLNDFSATARHLRNESLQANSSMTLPAWLSTLSIIGLLVVSQL
jgi:hypothetical protein